MLRGGIIGGFLLSVLVSSAEPEINLSNLPLSSLEERLTEIDTELAKLARTSLRSGVGSIGFRSMGHTKPETREWVEVSLDNLHPIDEIVLVPALWRDSAKGFQADGFPEAFRIIVGTDTDREGLVMATFDSTDKLLPRIAPLIIPINGTLASWVRIEATQMSRRAFDQRYVFQLSELMVFSNGKNIALRRPVRSSSVYSRGLAHAWDRPFLVDGHLPYLMDAAQGNPSVAFISPQAEHFSLSIDLGEARPLSQIHLHTVDQSDTVPQAYAGNLGLPETLLIGGGQLPDQSDAVPLLEIQIKSLSDTGPVIMWPLPEKAYRFVYIKSPRAAQDSRFGFAEIELLSNGQNVALNRPVLIEQPFTTSQNTRRQFSALTDGRNLYGNILPLRLWMAQLAQRHDLEIERPLVEAALTKRYSRQKRNLRLLTWLAVVLTAAIGFILLVDRILHMRHAQRIRQRFAADLHDELGANIHSIGLLTDLARETQSHEELLELLDRTRTFTQRSGSAVRYFTNSLETDNLCADLVEEMKRSSNRMLGDIEHELLFEGEDILHELTPRKRIDIFFFYKETLNNIVQHSGATHVSVRMIADENYIHLSIIDNGQGSQHTSGRITVPHSLRRRANLMGARVYAEQAPDGGTCIELKLRTKGRRLWQTKGAL